MWLDVMVNIVHLWLYVIVKIVYWINLSLNRSLLVLQSLENLAYFIIIIIIVSSLFQTFPKSRLHALNSNAGKAFLVLFATLV